MKKALRFLLFYYILLFLSKISLMPDEYLEHSFILDGCLFHYAHIWSKSGTYLHRMSRQTLRNNRNRPIFHHLGF